MCVMMFALVEPACARTWGEWLTETVGGGVIGAVVGGGVVVLTGGAALPIVAGCAAMGAAAGAADEKTRPAIVAGELTIVGTIATGGLAGSAAAGGGGGAAVSWISKFFGSK